MHDPDFTVRAASREEIDTIVGWAEREGWNPGLRDADCFHAADPDGFLIGLLRGEPVTAISAVAYGAAFGFLGFYLCVPEHRGKGYGVRTWEAALARLEKVRTIGLDGVVAQQANYARSGFVLEHRNIRFGGPSPAAAADPAIRPLKAADRHSVDAMDLACFGYARPAFLDAWLTAPGHRALGCFTGARLDGLAVTRPCREGTKVGPLFAVSAEVAERLFDAASGGMPGPVFLDTPESNAAAVALAERKGLRPSFETARMYLGPRPLLPLGEIFGITTFELG
jgi:GNAT superfamily N-acetyltransferase